MLCDVRYKATHERLLILAKVQLLYCIARIFKRALISMISWVSNFTRKLSPQKLFFYYNYLLGVASGKQLCNKMLLEAIPRNINFRAILYVYTITLKKNL